jgi:hypothetical protein
MNGDPEYPVPRWLRVILLVVVGWFCFRLLFLTVNIALTATFLSRDLPGNAILALMLVAFFVSAVLTYFIVLFVNRKTRGKLLR